MSKDEILFLIFAHYSPRAEAEIDMLRIKTIPSFAFILVGSMDCLSTVIGISYFGAIELNPVLSRITSTNLAAFVAIKLTAVLIVALMFHQANKALTNSQDKNTGTFKLANKTLKVSYLIATAVLLAAVVNNIIAFARIA